MSVLLPVLAWVLGTWGGLCLLVLAVLAPAFVRDRHAALEARERQATALPPGPAGWGWMTPGERAQFDAIVEAETAGEEG